MKRFFLAAALMLITASAAFAQLGGGTLSGTVTDEQGGVLPGVTVSAQGVDGRAVHDEAGGFRFLNLAPGPYTITLTLQGFTTVVRENVIVAVGKTSTCRHAAEGRVGRRDGHRQRRVARSSTRRATGTATNFTSDELTKIPTSRDPFALHAHRSPACSSIASTSAATRPASSRTSSSKGTRPQDAVWTMDGVDITDMAATGASPTYFNYDNFEEIQVSTAGQDIKQPTGGIGLNFVVKRGTNQFHGGVRGYFDNDAMESSNVPDELSAQGVTHETVGSQQADLRLRLRHRRTDLCEDSAWFYGSYSMQDVRLVRRAATLVDRTQLKNPNVKLNWQATKKDMVSFLYFDGFKIKDGRSPAIAGITFDAPTATFHQDNAYTDNPLHGLWKIADDRVFDSNMFLSGEVRLLQHRLRPRCRKAAWTMQAGRDFATAQSYGSVNQSLNVRPQQTVNVDVNSRS